MEEKKKKTKVKITGGKPLTGTLIVEVNKNAVLPVLCTTMLTEDWCVMKNTPKSPDVLKILQAIDELGGIHKWEGNTLHVCCKNLQNKPVSDCVNDIQSAILFLGPLLSKFGAASVPVAIGCKLGYRGPEDQIQYLTPFGVTVDYDAVSSHVYCSVDKKLLESDMTFQAGVLEPVEKHEQFTMASVTATENLLMLLRSATNFDSHLDGVAQEPHVKFLVKVLNKMGMNIKGSGNLVVQGCFGKMKGFECDFIFEPDYVDFYGNAIMIAMSKGSALLECYLTPAILHMVRFLENLGIHCEKKENGVYIDGSLSKFNPYPGYPCAEKTEEKTVYKTSPQPWPGNPVDGFPSTCAWACTNVKAGTAMVVNNWMYEDGLKFVHQLSALGANVETYNTGFGEQKACISPLLIGGLENDVVLGEKEVPVVIESIRAIISFALYRTGITIIDDIAPILRRSPNFIDKVNKSLGGQIEIIE